MKKYDVVALGELLIDFTENDISAQGNPMYEANPGGAPCNVLAMLTKLHHSVAFIGKVGEDGFGKQLTNAIKKQGIDTTGLCYDDKVHTTLAFVIKKEDGDRDFAFYRNPGADVNLRKDEVNDELIKNTKIFHLGSLSFTSEPAKSASIHALEVAEENHILISFDPNLREPLWSSLEKAHEEIDYVLQRCDILKISDNEIQWFTGKEDYDEGITYIRDKYPNIKLIGLSLGKEGSRAYYKDIKICKPAYLHDGPLETTGCGDTFCGCMLHTVLEKELDQLTQEDLEYMLSFANGAASIVSKRKGALGVMPTKEEIIEVL